MPISNLSFKEKSLLFARLASLAYADEKTATKTANIMGFNFVEFYDKSGAQAYKFMNKYDCVIACRGTQPNEFNDIKADLRSTPVIAETVSRVHAGFKAEVDELWPMISEDLNKKENVSKTLWFCGHSLGAGMATIMSSRCLYTKELNDPIELYTYGSPRVGYKKYCNSLGVTHHRWVNNNDIVTRVPLMIMGYRHHGIEHYMDRNGNVSKISGLAKVLDRVQGWLWGVTQLRVDSFSDHSMDCYIKNIENMKE